MVISWNALHNIMNLDLFKKKSDSLSEYVCNNVYYFYLFFSILYEL